VLKPAIFLIGVDPIELKYILSYPLKGTFRLPGLKARACSRFTLHFDGLSVLSLSQEAALFALSLTTELPAVEWVTSLRSRRGSLTSPAFGLLEISFEISVNP
jgi:hypothetical protein